LEIAMGFRTILVPIEQHDLMNSTLQTVLTLARQFDSYIEGFALRVDIPPALAVGDVGAVRRCRHLDRKAPPVTSSATQNCLS
jgi:hypothetical protein